MASRKSEPYKDGGLEVTLSLDPTKINIDCLSRLLVRLSRAIEKVYKLTNERDRFAGDDSDIQLRKVITANKNMGIEVGPKKVPAKRSTWEGL